MPSRDPAFDGRRRRALLAAVSATLPALLAACGGGGSDGPATPAAAPAPVPMPVPAPNPAPGAAASPLTALYRITLRTDWTAQNFATQFPANRHFSGLVGATHDATVQFWADDGVASLGIQRMAELGQKTALLDEVATAQRAGSADAALSGGGIPVTASQVSLEVTLSQRHPLLTLVSMVAPSPDWFVGVAGEPLFKDGAWLAQLTLALEVYDAGTDSGASFASADLVSAPRGRIVPVSSAPADTDLSAGLHRSSRQALASLVIERLA